MRIHIFMRIYIFHYVSGMTQDYHDGGGLVVIAEDAAKARALVKSREAKGSDDYNGLKPGFADTLDFRTATSYEIKATKPEVFVFRDAGCC